MTISAMAITFADHLFKRCHFDQLIITLRWYVSYNPPGRQGQPSIHNQGSWFLAS